MFSFVFERRSNKNQIGQSEISQNLTRALVFSIWGTFSKRRWGLINHVFNHRPRRGNSVMVKLVMIILVIITMMTMMMTMMMMMMMMMTMMMMMMMTALLMMCSDGVVPRRPSVVVYCPPVPIRCCSMVTARALSSIMQRQGYLSPCAYVTAYIAWRQWIWLRGICPSLCSTVLQELMASLQILRASVKIFGCTGWRACRAAVCCHWRRISALAVFRAWNWSAIQAHTFSINHVLTLEHTCIFLSANISFFSAGTAFSE